MPRVASRIFKFVKSRLGSLEARFSQHQARKRLRLRETLSLGDKRFLAVVEYRQHELLVGGTTNSITVLATSEPMDGVALEDGCIPKESLQ